MTPDQASIVALKALQHVAADVALLRRFLQESGTEPAALSHLAARPEFLAGVLDFLLTNEAILLAFCQAAGMTPEAPDRARRMLPGADREFE